MTLEQALKLVADEYKMAERKFPEFRSPHEGYAIMKEEVDELWDVIKNNQCAYHLYPNPAQELEEATQIAAMAIRYLVDLC